MQTGLKTYFFKLVAVKSQNVINVLFIVIVNNPCMFFSSKIENNELTAYPD
jgi:hypothetical protein